MQLYSSADFKASSGCSHTNTHTRARARTYLCTAWKWLCVSRNNEVQFVLVTKLSVWWHYYLLSTWNAKEWTTMGYAQVWCDRNYKYGSLQRRSQFAVTAVNLASMVDLGYISVWEFLFFFCLVDHTTNIPSVPNYTYYLGDAQYTHHNQ
jgi:hypothetical protein